MVSPINYMLDIKDPIEQAMRGYAMGRQDIEQRQIMGVREQQEGRAQETFAMQNRDREAARANAARQRAQAEASQAALADLAAKGLSATSDDFVAAWVANPAIRADLGQLQTMLQQPQMTALKNANQNIYSAASTNNPSVVARLLEEQIAVAQSPGGDPSVVDSLQFSLDLLTEDPEGGLAQIRATTGLTLLGLTSPEYMKRIDERLGVGGGDGPLQVRSSKILEDGTIVALTDGGPVVYSPSGEVVTGQAAADAVVEANEYGVEIQTARSGGRTAGQLAVKADLGAEVAGATEAGKLGIQLSGKIFENLGPLYSNISNLNRAIELVKEEGANTGILASKLPALDAATIELRNLRSQLGLDVIGAVTFGALSKGELNLALNVALPDNLTEDKLVGWLERKRDAQQKVINNLTMQAQFLGTPGRTPDKWIEFTRSGGETMSDMLSWMSENPIGGRIERVSPADPAAPAVAVSDDQAFVEQMTAKVNNGERLTQAETTRLNIIARGSQ